MEENNLRNKNMDKLNNKEHKAWENYEKTRDVKYLQVVKDCIDKRSRLLESKKPAMYSAFFGEVA